MDSVTSYIEKFKTWIMEWIKTNGGYGSPKVIFIAIISNTNLLIIL